MVFQNRWNDTTLVVWKWLYSPHYERMNIYEVRWSSCGIRLLENKNRSELEALTKAFIKLVIDSQKITTFISYSVGFSWAILYTISHVPFFSEAGDVISSKSAGFKIICFTGIFYLERPVKGSLEAYKVIPGTNVLTSHWGSLLR